MSDGNKDIIDQGIIDLVESINPKLSDTDMRKRGNVEGVHEEKLIGGITC